MATPENVTLDRLTSQYEWYNAKAKSNQSWFKGLKVTQIFAAAAIPVAATAGASATLAGVLGAVILVLESVQQLFQYQQNWVSYRSTAEALLAERHLYDAGAGPYAGVIARQSLLAERVEALLSKERSGWVAGQLPPGAGVNKEPAEAAAASGGSGSTADIESDVTPPNPESPDTA